MSWTLVFFIACCFAAFRLGAFAQANPGRIVELACQSTAWIWRSLSK